MPDQTTPSGSTPVIAQAATAAAVPNAPPPGKRFEITVADLQFAGLLAGVRFSVGVGYTDNPNAAFSLRQFGAVVEDRNPPKA